MRGCSTIVELAVTSASRDNIPETAARFLHGVDLDLVVVNGKMLNGGFIYFVSWYRKCAIPAFMHAIHELGELG